MPMLARSPSQAETEAFRNANSIRRCWICQQDDIDDTPDNSIWKKPCPCSFTAHDSCLLEWISNEEAPKPGDIARDRCIRCPQCKVQIDIQRPRDYIVTTVELIQRFSRSLVYPAAAASVLTCTYAGFLVYGINVFRVIFGNKEAQKVLYSHEHPTGLIWSLIRSAARDPTSQLASMSRVFLGAPLTAPSLILLRTKWADKVFSFIIPWYFLYPTNHKITWPPSPGFVFLTIPYLRTAYNEIYKLIFSDLETKWEMAVQRKPRAGETEEQVALEAVRDEDEEAFFEVRVALRGEENIDLPQPNEELPVLPQGLNQMQVHGFPFNFDPTENDDIGSMNEIEDILQPLAIIDDNDDDFDDDDDNDDDDDDDNNFYEEYGFDEHGIDLPPMEFHTLQRNSTGVGSENSRDRALDPSNHNRDQPDFENNNENNDFFNDIFDPSESDNEAPLLNARNVHAPNNRHILHPGANVDNNQRPVVHHFSANSLASLVMGALAFPFISATVGEILKYTLPSNLVTPTVSYSWGNKVVKKGILTEKWGRTVIGGCLFVFIKDAVTLYCKWKNAKIFGKRIVMDYAGDKKRN